MVTPLNTNQFSQVAIRGERDLQIQNSGVITGKISASQATALNPGDYVKLDTASGSVPSFIAAAVGDDAIGPIVYDAKRSEFNAGDVVSVAYHGGPVLFLEASGTIAAGAKIEDAGSGAVQTITSNPLRGIALDPATNGLLLRVITRNPLA